MYLHIRYSAIIRMYITNYKIQTKRIYFIKICIGLS